MKRFIKMLAVFAILALTVTLLLCVGIDPYNVFHADALRDNGVEPNSNYIKMRYILNNSDRFDALLFGSSRVGAIHAEGFEGVDCYNMTYSKGVPGEHLANIRTLVSEGVRLKRIYIGVDSLSYTENVETHTGDALRCPYETLVSRPLTFAKLYLNPTTAVASLRTSLSYVRGELLSPILSPEIYYNTGWRFDYDLVSQYDFALAPAVIGDADHIEQVLHDISAIAELCRGEGIELIVFVNPMYYITYEASLKQGFTDFLTGLAQVTDYYNFSGVNDVTTDPECFIDPSHYNAKVGDMMTAAMQERETDGRLLSQGFGMYVTRDNVDELLAVLEASAGAE